mmetsp:Transcript_15492/g.14023  ORF Transcript_15492/g.14023 Transcript_15492/m.14023 type:complete len:940 (+) Transcript_15492:57-2876(+)
MMKYILAVICCFVLSHTFKLTIKNNGRYSSFERYTSLSPDTETKVDINPISSPPIQKKVYQPRGDSKPYNQSNYTQNSVSRSQNAGNKYNNNYNNNNNNNYNNNAKKDSYLKLTNPQVLIRFRAPREQSDLKKRLLVLQETFKQESDKERSSSNRDNYSQSSNSGPGSVGTSSAAKNDKKPKSFSNFNSNSNTNSKFSSKDNDRRSVSNKREKNSRVDDDDDLGNLDEDNYDRLSVGGEEDAYVSLASLSGNVLREMELEGFTFDEMQLAIFGEYGIKASIPAIKRRLQDDKSDKKSRKKSGKTRREKFKSKSSKYRVEESNTVRFPPGISSIQVVELARLIGVGGGEVVKHLVMNLGMMVSLTQSVDIKIAKDIVEVFGKKLVDDSDDDDEDEEDDSDDETDDSGDDPLKLSRPPVVTIMGHVDHGKTTLLDRIRKISLAQSDSSGSVSSNFIPVAPGEAGGITQSISAFKVQTSSDKYVTFIDTPGHAAFSDMRKRGANVTDIVVLVVAADDGVMDQTKECIFAAKAANCPIVVAVNKIDKEGADPQGIITELMKYDVLVEEFGGDVQLSKLSAKQGIGIDDLLEKILLQAEIMNLKANHATKAAGTVIESRIDKRYGTVATVIVQEGILRVGDIILAGPGWGRVRKMLSDQGVELKEAGPSTPVQILGFSAIPNAGDYFSVVEDEAAARTVAEARVRLARQTVASSSIATMMSQAATLSEGGIDNREIIKVPVVIKGDVSGSVEALKSALANLRQSDKTAICEVDIVASNIGEVTASDVAIAAVSKAKILAFNVGTKSNVMDLARGSNVEIGFYNVVYDLLDEIEKTVKETLSPPPPGQLVGKAEIKKAFKVGKVGKVAGCLVTEGLIKAGSKIRIMRGSRNPIFTGKMSSLKIVKESVSEVIEGSECGISFVDFQDFLEGDIIECFSVNETTESE